MSFLHQNQGSLRLRDLRRKLLTHFLGSLTQSQMLVHNDRIHKNMYCRTCGKSHGVWGCPEFKQMNAQNRRACAKQNKFCFHCLGEGHQGQFVTARGCVVLTTVRRYTIDYYTVVQVNHPQTIRQMNCI